MNDDKTFAVTMLREILPALNVLVQQNGQWLFRPISGGSLPEYFQAVATRGFHSPDEAINAFVDSYYSRYVTRKAS